MQLSEEVHFPADVATVAQMLGDPAFIEAKIRATGATPDRITVTPGTDGATTIAVRFLVPTAAIPSQIRAFVGTHLDVRQVEVWEDVGDGTRRATIAVEIIGAPVRMTGTVTLVPETGGSVETYTGLVKAGVPIFGTAVESGAAGALHDIVAAEERVAREWLVGRSGQD